MNPIFVLGCQRSGTSLLRRVLDSHSNIACPPESAFFVQLARVYEIKRALRGLTYMGFSDAEVLAQMRVFFSHFFESYAERKGKSRWAEKTCHYLNHVETIDFMFRGEAIYVGIIRHGLDVAYSLCGLKWPILSPYMADGTEKPLAAVRFWQDQTIKLLDFRKKVGDRFHLVRYEDLTAEPRPVLQSLFRFLGEPWEEAVLNYNDFDHDAGFEDLKVAAYDGIVPNSGNYRNWPLAVQEQLYQEAHALLARLDYEILRQNP
jgi:hypothetical protein